MWSTTGTVLQQDLYTRYCCCCCCCWCCCCGCCCCCWGYAIAKSWLSTGGSPRLSSPTAGEQKGGVASSPGWPFASYTYVEVWLAMRGPRTSGSARPYHRWRCCVATAGFVSYSPWPLQLCLRPSGLIIDATSSATKAYRGRPRTTIHIILTGLLPLSLINACVDICHTHCMLR